MFLKNYLAQLNLPPNFEILQLQRCLVRKIKHFNPYEIIDYDLEHQKECRITSKNSSQDFDLYLSFYMPSYDSKRSFWGFSILLPPLARCKLTLWERPSQQSTDPKGKEGEMLFSRALGGLWDEARHGRKTKKF